MNMINVFLSIFGQFSRRHPYRVLKPLMDLVRHWLDLDERTLTNALRCSLVSGFDLSERPEWNEEKKRTELETLQGAVGMLLQEIDGYDAGSGWNKIAWHLREGRFDRAKEMFFGSPAFRREVMGTT